MNLKVFDEFMAIFDESGLTTSYEDYRRLIVIALSAVFILTAVVSGYVHVYLLRVQGAQLILGVGLSTLIVSLLALVALFFYPFYQRGQMESKIDNNLIYTVSYMAVLASSGVSFERIMENVSGVEDEGPLKRLAVKFMADVQLLGFNLSRAIKDMVNRSPSRTLSQLLEGVDNISQTSGDLKSLMDFNYGQLLQDKKQQLVKMLNTLSYIGEIYVTLMVVAPILFIVMLTILTILGGGTSVGGAVIQLNLLVFFGIPLFAAAFLIVLDTVLGVEE
jgi:archaellum biogenesis protein FlaJ (TadC family)